jgi:hypothetical protein
MAYEAMFATGVPFFMLLKKSGKFEWTDEVDQVLEELKTFLLTPQSWCHQRLK